MSTMVRRNFESSTELDFEDNVAAFRPKSTGASCTSCLVVVFCHVISTFGFAAELWRAYIVLTTSSIGGVAKYSDTLMKLSERLLGDRLTYAIVRRTFFAHFCAGETAQEVAPITEKLMKYGVGGILDYAAEGDVDADGEVQPFRGSGLQARVYDYAGEVVIA